MPAPRRLTQAERDENARRHNETRRLAAQIMEDVNGRRYEDQDALIVAVEAVSLDHLYEAYHAEHVDKMRVAFAHKDPGLIRAMATAVLAALDAWESGHLAGRNAITRGEDLK